jgi:Arc/MetJ-type ribon-helix-helix transcriptional regulator
MEDDGTKITFRIPEGDLKELERLIPARFLNVSDAVRAAVRLLINSSDAKKERG